MVAKQVMNARTGVTIRDGMNGMVNSIPMAAPRDAPDDNPSMYGDAKGFLNTACMAAPVTANPAPTKIPTATRGALFSRTMMLDDHVPFPMSASQTSENE